MRLDYGFIQKKLVVLWKRLLIAGGLLLLPVSIRLDKLAAAQPVGADSAQVRPVGLKADPRTTRLATFLSRLHCPIASMAADFVQAADENRLDWRLLPSISVIESGGGKAYRNNNIFGWNNGLDAFPSLRAALDLVASRLGHSPIYRNRDLIGKLHLYNPDESYADKVLDVMNRISTSVNLRTVPSPSRIPVSIDSSEAGE
jgi:hypothetical protein